MTLSGDTPHLPVLDGLERMQSEGGDRRRGQLKDAQLRRLIRALASAGNARVLLTSRFPLVDLDDFTEAGHRAISLDDLELSAAISLLRAWSVRGDDAALIRALTPLNINDFYHALSVAVLGSFLRKTAGGDPSLAPDFSLEEAEETDSKAVRLRCILKEYADALSQVERDLLARLSIFPEGATVEFLVWIAQSARHVAGAIGGLANRQLVNQCAVKGAGLQRVQLPPGNWFAPPGRWDEKVDPRSRIAISYRDQRTLEGAITANKEIDLEEA